MNSIITIPEKIGSKLRKAGYGISYHATVELCHWTKKSLKNEGVCYKRVFYGIDAHRCVEFSPAGMICSFRCNFCWRLSEFMKSINMNVDEVLDPDVLIEGILKERRRLLSGYPGNPKVDKKLLFEAHRPTHYAISLSGEPTIYPKLPELIKYLKSLPNTRSIFLVTNGAHPDMLRRLEEEDALPTQLYISINAPNEELFRRINHPMISDAWHRFMESLKIMSKINTRTVIRMTMIRGWNDNTKYIDEYVKLLRIAYPHFIEIKSYMHVGYSTRRLRKENMFSHDEIKKYSRYILDRLNYFKYMDEYPPSRIVVIQNMRRYIDRWIP
jgi:tRNA wybutosine-synthesizing protein 1